MATESKESIEHHIQTYIRVFIALGVLTVITVAVSYLNVSFFIAMTVATIKGSLVLGYFMHLITERQMIIWILVATVTTFIILMFIPLISLTDQVTTWD